jgi:hypothetical protein
VEIEPKYNDDVISVVGQAVQVTYLVGANILSLVSCKTLAGYLKKTYIYIYTYLE